MAGFDNGTAQEGTTAQTKQFGSILRGFGPPAPQAGLLGDLYVDTQTGFLYGKRSVQGADPWGNYLFQVPATYLATLKWFSAYLPGNDVGVAGDYCLLWAGFNNYGVQPSIFGPNAGGFWPESGSGPTLLLDPADAGLYIPVGLLGEDAAAAYATSTQLVVVGLSEEYILAIPITQLPSSPVVDEGLRSTPTNVPVNLNPLYNAINQHTA